MGAGSCDLHRAEQTAWEWWAVPDGYRWRAEALGGHTDVIEGSTQSRNHHQAMVEIGAVLLRSAVYGGPRVSWAVHLWDGHRLIHGWRTVRILDGLLGLRAACFPGPVIYAREVGW